MSLLFEDDVFVFCGGVFITRKSFDIRRIFTFTVLILFIISVIIFPFFLVAEYFIRLLDFLKPFYEKQVVVILIGMVFE